MHSLFLLRDHHLCILSGMWVWTRCAKSVRVDKFGQGQARKIDTLAVAVCVALLEHPYAFLWLSANTATSEDNNRSGRHQQSTKTNKPIFLLLAWISNILLYGT
jgi:hypothetical protein